MRKLFFLIFLCVFGWYVNAQDLELTNEIIRFDKIETFNLQGFTIANNYIFAVLVNENDTESIIKVFDISTYEEIESFRGDSLGHANDVTYNKNANKIYVLNSGDKNIHIFDSNTFKYLETIQISVPLRSITYIEDYNSFAGRIVTTGYFLNDTLEKKSDWPFIVGLNVSSDVGRQGWAYYNNYIYYATWSWIRLGGTGENKIYIYDLKGNKIDELLTKNDVGELEDIAFTNNKMLLGFNGYNNYVAFYLEDIPKINEEIKSASEKELQISEEDTDNSLNLSYIVALILIFILGFIIKLLFSKKKKRL